ncbi:MAG: hypothetical protein PHD10_02600, partial [Bacilli bacterium]|nr:hypothetical protein [Bacilli bacterium]
SHYVSYGGKYLDEFRAVKETSDGGYIAVGKSNSEVITKYGNTSKGKNDAIIVKYKSDGTLEWSHNYGGSKDDLFNDVVEVTGGYVVVGTTYSNDGDIVEYKGGDNDAIIVKYDNNGNIVYKRSYGSDNTENNSGSEVFHSIIKDGNDLVIVGTLAGFGDDGDLTGVTGLVRANEGVIIKMDSNFNTLWRDFFVGTFNEVFQSITKTNDNHYLVVGSSSSNDYDVAGIGFATPSYQNEAIILKYDNSGNIINKKSFRGSKHEAFNSITEVNDGYIAVGESYSNDYDMEGLNKANNGYLDGIVVKYDKNLENILWKKSFGGTNNDSYHDLLLSNDNEILVTGYSKSSDMDMQGLVTETNGYSNAIIVSYNVSNGNVITKKVFGGTNSDIFYSAIKTTDNHYVMTGKTFSNDNNLKNFNKGHSDGIIVKYDSNLNLVKNLKEPVVIIDKLKTIVPNYGTDISLKYDNLYTSNDPAKDLKSWCTNSQQHLEGNTSNYFYSNCLKSFNEDDRRLLVEMEVGNGLKMYAGEYEYKITQNTTNINNWHQIVIANSGSSGSVGYSNLKLKFADGYVGHITDAIDKGYIEPLVTVWSYSTTVRPIYLLPNVIDIINENGNTGVGSFPTMYIHFKPKKSRFVSVILTSTAKSANNDGLGIYEIRNFDISIAKTE